MTSLVLVTTLVPDDFYATGILSVKFRSLAGKVVFFRPFVSRKSSSGGFVDRVVAVFPNGDLHLFDADGHPKRGVHLSKVASVLQEGATVVLIFNEENQEDLQLRFDGGPAQKVTIKEPAAAPAASNVPISTMLPTPKAFVSIVNHFSPALGFIKDVKVGDLALELKKPHAADKPVDIMATAAIHLRSNQPRPLQPANSDETVAITPVAATREDHKLAAEDSAQIPFLTSGTFDGGPQIDDDDDAPNVEPYRPQIPFRQFEASSERYLPENEEFAQSENFGMFGELKGLLLRGQGSPPNPEDAPPEPNPLLHKSLSSVRFRQHLANQLEAQRALSGESRHIPTNDLQMTPPKGNIVNVEDYSVEETAADGSPSPAGVLARLRKKLTELKIENLLLLGEVKGVGSVADFTEDDLAQFGSNDQEVVNLYADRAHAPASASPQPRMFPTKSYQRAINLSILVLNVCRRRRQAVLIAMRQTNIEAERRALEQTYFVSKGLPPTVSPLNYLAPYN